MKNSLNDLPVELYDDILDYVDENPGAPLPTWIELELALRGFDATEVRDEVLSFLEDDQ